ncbi:hypothetical protein Hdeb2414_s0024g00645231 [Helianthus debilis subsp. tardiflorus]
MHHPFSRSFPPITLNSHCNRRVRSLPPFFIGFCFKGDTDDGNEEKTEVSIAVQPSHGETVEHRECPKYQDMKQPSTLQEPETKYYYPPIRSKSPKLYRKKIAIRRILSSLSS